MQRARAGHGDADLDRRGGEPDRADADAVAQDVRAGGDVQPDGAVDARTRVPAAARLLAVARDHADGILPPVPQEGVRLDIKVRIAVRAAGGLFAVQIHLCAAVDPLKFQRDQPVLVLRGDEKGLFILVVVPREPARVRAARRAVRPFLADHRVVRQGDGRPRPFAQPPVLPPVVEEKFLHGALPFFFHCTTLRARAQDFFRHFSAAAAFYPREGAPPGGRTPFLTSDAAAFSGGRPCRPARARPAKAPLTAACRGGSSCRPCAP